jgi:hypothetical protein
MSNELVVLRKERTLNYNSPHRLTAASLMSSFMYNEGIWAYWVLGTLYILFFVSCLLSLVF